MTSSFNFFTVSSFLFLIIFLLSLSHGGVNGANLIDETCKKAAGPNLNYDFCVSSLQTDPKSQTADVEGLGIISIELAIKNATFINSYIDKLLKDGKLNPKAKKYLEDCLEVYSDSITNAQGAIEAFKFKDYETANIDMSSLRDASTTCEDGFKEEKGLTSPLTKEDGVFLELTSISLAIINMFN